MHYEAILFDLDGTLIDFDTMKFIKLYLGAAAKYFRDVIDSPEYFTKAILDSTSVMEHADTPNQLAFYDFFNDFCPKFDSIKCDEIINRFKDFYASDFAVVEPIIRPMDGAKDLIDYLKNNFSKTKLVVATNPVFPLIAITQRMKWGGINPEDFDYITHAENSYFCKGNTKYWSEISEKIGIDPSKSLVVGNDGLRDMSAKLVGYKTFFIESTAERKEGINSKTEPDYRGEIKDIFSLINN